MTNPTYKDQISLENIIQIIVLVVAMSGAFMFVRHQGGATANETKNISVKLSQLKDRVRGLEVRSASDIAHMEAVRRDISEIKTSQRESNALLRQLLGQAGKKE